jgi:hypothetical protein
MELDVRKRFKDYEQTAQDLSLENEELKKRVAENVNRFNIELEKINATLSQRSQEN